MVVHTEPQVSVPLCSKAGQRGDGARFAEIVQLSSEDCTSSEPPTTAKGVHPRHTSAAMEEGTKTKKTVFIGGIGDDVDESVILEAFQTFGG